MKIAFKVDATVVADDAVDAVEVGTRAYATVGAGRQNLASLSTFTAAAHFLI